MAGTGPLHFKLEADCANKECWQMGRVFSRKDEDPDFRPPARVIELRTKIDSKAPERVYPELTWNPLPLMTRRLVSALQSSGISNLQTYDTRLTNPQGKTPPDHYLAVNIVGLVAAADLIESQTDPQGTETLLSVDFQSLTVDPMKSRDALIFRLAENVSAVLVHERIRKFVTDAGIYALTWYEPQSWAG
jgi:hypothetical protein